ncbi:MAG: carbonic anhydrase [Acidobacteriota bacterium]
MTKSTKNGDQPCGCSVHAHARRLKQRRLLYLAGATPAGRPAVASAKYEALVLACIDPRLQAPVFDYLQHKRRKLAGKYSQVNLAGAAIAAVAQDFAGWHQTFWDNLDLSVSLHKVSRVIVIQHRDCGAMGALYGGKPGAGPAPPDHEARRDHRRAEKQLHLEVVETFGTLLEANFPKLGLEAILMDLDGKTDKLI